MADGTTGLYTGRNVAIGAANDDVLTDIVIPNGICMITVWAQVSLGSIVNVMRTDSLGTRTHAMKENAALVAGALSVFDVKVNPGDTINIQVETWATGAVFESLDIEGVYSGVR